MNLAQVIKLIFKSNRLHSARNRCCSVDYVRARA